MAIEDFYNTDFTIYKLTELKVDGRITTSWTEGATTKGAIFTPSTERTVRFGKKDFVIDKNLYTKPTTDVDLGDYVSIDGGNYDVVFKQNTNNLNHHLSLGLVKRES